MKSFMQCATKNLFQRVFIHESQQQLINTITFNIIAIWPKGTSLQSETSWQNPVFKSYSGVLFKAVSVE